MSCIRVAYEEVLPMKESKHLKPIMAYVKCMLHKWTNVWRRSLWTPTAHVMQTDVTDEPHKSCLLRQREDTSQLRQRLH